MPCKGDFVSKPVFQIVFRNLVLKIAHDESGHLGVRKTYDRVLLWFFILKYEISNFTFNCAILARLALNLVRLLKQCSSTPPTTDFTDFHRTFFVSRCI